MQATKLILSLPPFQKRRIFLALDVALVPLALFLSRAAHDGGLSVPALNAVPLPLIAAMMLSAAALSIGLKIATIRLKDFDRSAVLRLAVLAGSLGAANAAFGLMSAAAPGLVHSLGFGIIYFALICMARIALIQIVLAVYRRSSAVTRVLIYGAGNSGMTLAAALRRRADVIPVAFIDDNPALQQINVAGLPVLSRAQAEIAISAERIDAVIIAAPSVSFLRRTLLARSLNGMGVRVLTLPAYWGVLSSDDAADPLEPFGPRILVDQCQLDDGGVHPVREYAGASILISGAGGSIGLELCRQVAALRPGRLVLVEMSEFALYEAARECRALVEGTPVQVVPVLGSVTDHRMVERALRENAVDIVLHAAAYKHVPLLEENALTGLSNNILGAEVLAQLAGERGVRKFILVSSDKALCPLNAMGASKRVAELVVNNIGRKFSSTIYSTVRFGNVLGSSGSVLPLFQEQIASGGPITVTDPAATRYFMTIEEAASLVLIAGGLATGGEAFALDMGRPLTILELARRTAALSGLKIRDSRNPDGEIEIVTIGLRPGEKLHERPLISKNALATPHPKIMKSYDEGLSELETAALLRKLKDAFDASDEAAAIRALRQWLPDYAEHRVGSRAASGRRRLAEGA